MLSVPLVGVASGRSDLFPLVQCFLWNVLCSLCPLISRPNWLFGVYPSLNLHVWSLCPFLKQQVQYGVCGL